MKCNPIPGRSLLAIRILCTHGCPPNYIIMVLCANLRVVVDFWLHLVRCHGYCLQIKFCLMMAWRQCPCTVLKFFSMCPNCTQCICSFVSVFSSSISSRFWYCLGNAHVKTVARQMIGTLVLLCVVWESYERLCSSSLHTSLNVISKGTINLCLMPMLQSRVIQHVVWRPWRLRYLH